MPVNISTFLSQDDVIVDLRVADKPTLLQELARRAADSVNVPAEAILLELNKREQLGSTGMGDGIAIPHARFAAMKTPFGIFARLKPAIDFDAVDGKPVDLVFLLLVPSSSQGEHLNALAGVARRLRDRQAVEKIRAVRDRDSVYHLMTAEVPKPGQIIK
jgi:PTS system nitrogen regulatory IIA component